MAVSLGKVQGVNSIGFCKNVDGAGGQLPGTAPVQKGEEGTGVSIFAVRTTKEEQIHCKG